MAYRTTRGLKRTADAARLGPEPLAGIVVVAIQLLDDLGFLMRTSKWIVYFDWALYFLYGAISIGFPLLLIFAIAVGILFKDLSLKAGLVILFLCFSGVFAFFMSRELRVASRAKIKSARGWFFFMLIAWFFLYIADANDSDWIFAPGILLFATWLLFISRVGEKEWFEEGWVRGLSDVIARLVSFPVKAKGVIVLFGWLGAWGFWQSFVFTEHDSPRALAAGFATIGILIRLTRGFWHTEDKLLGIEVASWPMLCAGLAVLAYFFGHYLP